MAWSKIENNDLFVILTFSIVQLLLGFTTIDLGNAVGKLQ